MAPENAGEDMTATGVCFSRFSSSAPRERPIFNKVSSERPSPPEQARANSIKVFFLLGLFPSLVYIVISSPVFNLKIHFAN